MASPFFHRIQQYQASGIEFLSLGLGQSDRPEHQRIYDTACSSISFDHTRYSNPQGLVSLRTAMSLRLRNQNHIHCGPSNIMVTFGAKQALFLACSTLLSEGDEVVVLSPCYISNLPILELLQRKITIRQFHLSPPQFSIDCDRLGEFITPRTRMLWMNYPNNPTGATLSREEYDFLVEQARQKDFFILSDELYDELTFDDAEHFSPAAEPSIADRVITVNSLSKSFNMTGWRIGYLCTGEENISHMVQFQKNTIGNVPEFIQLSALTALDECGDYVREFRRQLQHHRDLMDQVLGSVPNLEFSRPRGGYFSFIRISEIRPDSDTFAHDLLTDEKVAVLPGGVLGKDYDGYIRISMAVNTADFTRAIHSLARFAGGS